MLEKKIEAKMKGFPNLSWMINVYPPHGGWDKHATNVNVFFKRQYNKNIAIHIVDNNQQSQGSCPFASPGSERECFEFSGDESTSGGFVGTECVDIKQTWDARRIYDETKDKINASGIRRFGLVVFRKNRDDDSFISSNGNTHCSRKLNQNPGNDFQISYLY